ncbi:biotin transporter BioY [Sulfitobacter pacificus]|uniref:Biotin transporter n=1 Tax=Sulfitobacter pacificus TaxID=1499314 RepID=A0ABQ5VPV3_9RHOB|nr:biotin transporter BioY [Sulfitobacter pacificus]GLQ29189.1 biotin transporter BioY [Sulfitobacter pacificus]
MTTRDIVFVALFSAIMAALAAFPPVTLPLIGVPITAQSLGVMLAGGVLGALRGGLAVILFLILVAIGLPLLAGGRGGFGVFLGPTGGYLIGWIVAAIVIGYMMERYWIGLNYLKASAGCLIGGVVVLYAIGVPWSAVVVKIPVSTALIGSLPFIPGDVVKALIAAAVVMIVKRSYPIIQPKAAVPH